MVGEMYPNPNAEPNSNFKKIPLNSKLWRDSSFDEVSIVIVYGSDTDSDVFIGMWEAREDYSEDEESTQTSIGLLAPHKLSEVANVKPKELDKLSLMALEHPSTQGNHKKLTLPLRITYSIL